VGRLDEKYTYLVVINIVVHDYVWEKIKTRFNKEVNKYEH
jgi:hypothetical protein